MDAPKKNKLAMYEATDVVLTRREYQPIWKSTPAFLELHNDFAAVLEEINQLSGTQGRRKTGLAEQKDASRQAMCKAANVLAGQMAAYAHKAGNHELLTRATTSLSILMSGRGKDSRDKCSDILTAATANLAALDGCGVKQAGLDNLEKLIKAFDEASPQPQVARARGKSAGQAQDAAFDRADGILNNGIDKLMLQFEDSRPDFFRDYTNARVIIDLPGGHGNGKPPPTSPTTPPK